MCVWLFCPVRSPALAPVRRRESLLDSVEGRAFGKHHDQLGTEKVSGQQDTAIAHGSNFWRSMRKSVLSMTIPRK
jgi:hypothetical protein